MNSKIYHLGKRISFGRKKGSSLTVLTSIGVLLFIFTVVFSPVINSPVIPSSVEKTPRESTIINNGLEAPPLNFTIVRGNEKQADTLYISVGPIIATNSSLYEAGDVMNVSTLLHRYYEIIDTADNNKTLYKGDFEFIPENNSWYAEHVCSDLPESDSLVIKTNFTDLLQEAYSVEISQSFSVIHYIYTELLLNFDPEADTFTVIVIKARETYEDQEILPDNAVVAKATIYSNETGDVITEANLTYDETTGYWSATFDASKINEAVYATVSFQTTEVHSLYTSDPSIVVEKEIGWKAFLPYLYGAIVLVVIGLIGIFAYVKKQEKAIERPVETKDKPIEIVSISKAELKKKKLTKPPKKKVKKMDESGLIFNVPTWEVEEDEEEPAETAEAVAAEAQPSATIYTLHCPKCNSWYEVDFWEEMECPKCGTQLEIAMWCEHCKKWFDVPQPMEVDCPICGNKLKYASN